MERLIKSVPVSNGELYEIAAGQRTDLADFTGTIEIWEKTVQVPILGRVQKGPKEIHASFIVCGDLSYHRENIQIHSGKVYEAVGDVENRKLDFAGLRFTDSDPIENTLTFEIPDLELIQKLLTI